MSWSVQFSADVHTHGSDGMILGPWFVKWLVAPSGFLHSFLKQQFCFYLLGGGGTPIVEICKPDERKIFFIQFRQISVLSSPAW